MHIDYPRGERTGVRRWLPSWRQVLSLAALGFLAVVGTFVVAVAVTPVPAPNEVARAEATIVYWNDGRTELGRLGQANRVSVPLSDVPLDVQHAVLAAEDRDFYDHGGFSPAGIGRAVWNNLTGGSTQGASTITQQYIKNAFLTAERTWTRKLHELVLSVKLENVVSKDQILEDYLNTIYFGRGAYGIETAAQVYFGRHAKDLTLAQGAALAAVIRSPGRYSPDTAAARLKGRWLYVLDGMVQKSWITARAKKAAVFPAFLPRRRSSRLGGQNGYLLEAVRRELLARGFDESAIDGGGLRVVSTFDRRAEAAAIAAVRDAGPTSGTEGLRIGLAAVQPGTGNVLALYGGRDYLVDQYDNATQAIAQAGSTFKPFAAAAALEEGIGLSSLWDGSSPRTISGYRLRNYGGASYGTVTLLRATEQSVNTAYVDLTQKVGVDKVIDAATRAGIPATTPGIERNLTFVLGTASPHAVDLASAYATFADSGRHASPTVLQAVRDADGQMLYQSFPRPAQVFSAAVAAGVTEALVGVVTDGTGSAAQELGRPAAGKTGTTDGNRSAWFVGYTPQISAAVMMVKEDAKGRPVSLSGTGGMQDVTGGSFPAEIWTAFTRAALEGQSVAQFPGEGEASASAAPTQPLAPQSPSPSPSDSPTDTPTDTPTDVPTDVPTTDAPVPDTPTTDAPVPDTPAPDTPTTDAPTTDAPVPDTPTTDAPVPDTPAPDTPTTAPAEPTPAPTDVVPPDGPTAGTGGGATAGTGGGATGAGAAAGAGSP